MFEMITALAHSGHDHTLLNGGVIQLIAGIGLALVGVVWAALKTHKIIKRRTANRGTETCQD